MPLALASKKSEPAATPKAKASLTALRIGEPDDAFEEEADRVADEVARGGRIPGWSLSKTGFAKVQRRTAGADGRAASEAHAAPIDDVLGANGRALDRETRRFMESRFGLDFRNVRVHSDARAAASASALGATAYAVGDHVVFGAGQYSPETFAGRKILAHELTHTVQQQEGKAPAKSEGRNAAKPASGTAPPSVQRALASPGRPLNPALRRGMDRRLGHDFSRVRIHSGEEAQNSAREVEAEAYTVGHDIVFGVDPRVTETAEGQRLLAHELTHVLQHESTGAPERVLRRKGRSFRGFLANIFQFWGYSKSTLDEYLQELDKTNQIVGDDDSDDMARQVVEEWRDNKASHHLTPKVKILLVREMLDGVVSGADQQRIMDLLEGSVNADLRVMFETGPMPLALKEISSRFKSETKRLEFFDRRVLQRLKEPDSPGGKSAETELGDVQKLTGLDAKQLTLSFHLAPGALKSSFAADLVVPAWGSQVDISLDSSHLHISINPGLIIDVLGPFNATLSGVAIKFGGGLLPQLELEGPSPITGLIKSKVLDDYVKPLLAGTRFEDPSYNPIKDATVAGEFTGPEISGDLDRLKFNFERMAQGNDGDSGIGDKVSGFGLRLDMVYQPGIPAPTSGWGVVVPPGTGFYVQIYTYGNATDLLHKEVKLAYVDVVSTGIFINYGQQQIAQVWSVRLAPGLKVKLNGKKFLVDLRQFAKQDAPDWMRGKVFDWLTENLSEGFVEDAAVWVGEAGINWLIGNLFAAYRDQIKSGIGVTDKQIDNFFSVGAEEERQ